MICPRCQRPTPPGGTAAVCDACASGLPGASPLAREVEALPPGDERRLELLRHGPRALAAARRWDELEAVLSDLPFLEAKAAAGFAFDLPGDFADALRHLPADRPARRALALLDEALRRDLYFIARHPSLLFQCLWNNGWWYDAPQAAAHHDPPEEGWPPEGPPWERQPRLAALLESWRRARERRNPGAAWLRSLRPPPVPLGGAQRALIPVDTDRLRFLNLAFSAGGAGLFAWLAPSGARDGVRQLRAWDAESGREADPAAERGAPPWDPALSPDGRWRAEFGGPGGGWGRPVRLLDNASGSVVTSLATDPDVNIQEVAFSPGGERLIGGGWGDEGVGEVMVWNVATGRRLAWLRPNESVFAVAVSFDGRRAATGTSDGASHLWDIEAGAVAAVLEGHVSAVQALAFDAAGRRLASASHDGTVRVWEVGRVAPLHRLRGHPDGIVDVTFSTYGRRLVTASANCTTWIWDGEEGAPVARPYASRAVVLEGGPPRNGVYADRRHVVSLACGATWDAATGDVVTGSAEGKDYRFLSCEIVWTPAGDRFAAFGRVFGYCGIGTPGRGEGLRLLEGHAGDVTAAAFSPDGRRLVTGSQDGTARLWDGADGAALAVLRGHEGTVTCVAFSPDGGRVASAGTDRTVRVWDAASAVELARLHIADPGVWSRGWSSDGGSWEVHAVAGVAFSADGRHLLTLSERDRIRVWDPATGACLRTDRGVGDFRAVAAGAPWRGFLRGDVLEVESPERKVVARAPHPRGLLSRGAPVTRPDGRAWAAALGRHLYFWALCGPAFGDVGALAGRGFR